MPEQPSLETLQGWMSIVVQHKVDVHKGARSKAARNLIPLGSVTRGEVVLPNDRMTPTARLQVYGGGYFTRLKEVLEADYKVLLHAMGAHAFFHLALDYVERFPSRHPNLNHFGKQLPEFIDTRKGLGNRAFFRDLARLERAMSEAFDSPEFESVDMSTLEHLTPDQWNGAVFTANPSVRVLRFSYNANAYLQGVMDKKKPELPPRRTSSVAVYRRDDRIWRLNLPRPMYLILNALVNGEPFGEALVRGGDHHLDVSKWFQDWSGDGLFSSIDVRGS